LQYKMESIKPKILVKHNAIIGFLYNSTPDFYKKLSLKINGKIVANAKAIKWHKKAKIQDNYVFKFSFKNIENIQVNTLIEIIDSVSQLSIKGSPFFFRNKIDSPFYYLHIPKTAGTTFRSILWEKFNTTEVFP